MFICITLHEQCVVRAFAFMYNDERRQATGRFQSAYPAVWERIESSRDGFFEYPEGSFVWHRIGAMGSKRLEMIVVSYVEKEIPVWAVPILVAVAALSVLLICGLAAAHRWSWKAEAKEIHLKYKDQMLQHTRLMMAGFVDALFTVR